MADASDLLVIQSVRDWTCAQCQGIGDLLIMDEPGPLCLACADLDHLVFLPAGDAALTRRAKKASGLSAVVVRWSRTRKRYERQGLLVEETALEQAEQQCLADEDARVRRRERDRERRAAEDVELAATMADEIRRLFPRCPARRAEAIARHASLRGSGRVGRSAAGRSLDEKAITLAVVASVRHEDTEYDSLLMSGISRESARDRTRADVDRVLAAWRMLVADPPGAATRSHGMNVSLDEHRLGGLRWIVLRGPDREAFRALGEHMRDEMAALTRTWGLVARLREHVSGPPGSDRLASVRRASAHDFPEAWAELTAFAEGCAVPFEDLALMNFRGDLGPVTGGIGCSDLAWRRERSLIGHNEDGAPENAGQCVLLTLALDGLPTVTAFWYPGFLPANAFAVTADGLVWTIDHLPVAEPGDGAARHFVGRGLQRSARTLDAAVDYLKTHPSAGGFAYTIGDPDGRIVSVEAMAGRHAVVEAGPSGPLLWHTNHGRYLPGAEPAPEGTSVARGQTLSALAVPEQEQEQDPDPAWFLRILAEAPLPHGVRRDREPGDPAVTLCTFIADLTAGQAVIANRDEPPVTIPLRDLAEGRPHRQRQLASAGGPSDNPGRPCRSWPARHPSVDGSGGMSTPCG